ncbi:MAG: porphobilinogen synthase [Deltaproteobacteria bacterium]|nr:porphobilinogen synthase [Candidatus Zymogenaceae bacterium]
MFPVTRMRRLRMKEPIRRMVEETKLAAADFIYPMFVVFGADKKEEIPAMPGIFRLSTDHLVREAERVRRLGIKAVILFGIPEIKDEMGSSGYDDDGVVQRAVRALKEHIPDLVVITDVCLCEYTNHGHCGIVADGTIVNDPTVELLTRMALTHVRAGADMVAPSDMMDGRVGSIRRALDEEGFVDIPIMSYTAKYASGFYGPFREAAGSVPAFGDRRSHQMDPPNVREALRQAAADVEEGADIIMVKPALAYLDVISLVRDRFDLPIAAYSVSGEYSMVKAAAKNGWIDGERVMMEILLAIKRSGADLIISYFAPEAAEILARQTS